MNSAVLTIFMLLIFSGKSFAYEDESVWGYIDSQNLPAPVLNEESVPPSSGDRLRKFHLALDTLQIPRENTPDFSDFPFGNQISASEMNARFSVIDPDAGLRRYLNIDSTSVSLYQDFWSSLLPQSLVDYALSLNPSSASQDSQTLLSRLNQISNQVKDPTSVKPLSGLKVVIDPGHMGTPDWDELTGKYVEINQVRVSEGQLNLWTALLTANELEALGAQVTLTRTLDGPVAASDYRTFDSTPFINQYFYNSLDSWMKNYLGLSDSELVRKIKLAPEVKKIYTSDQKTQLFIGGADLEARSQIIDQEKPDVVIDIHFDADKANQLQSAVNTIEAFVPGSFRETETGSRVIRSYALKHLLEARRWNESVHLASAIIGKMSQNLKLPLHNVPEFLTAIRVKDGVYARNLYINRRNLSSLMVYLECLHYDHVKEFPVLSKKDQMGTYRGMSFSYPARIQLISTAVRDGILDYFKKSF